MFEFMYGIPNWGVFILCILIVFGLMILGAAFMAAFRVVWPVNPTQAGIVNTILSGILLPTGIVIAFVASDIWQQDLKGRTAVEQEAVAIANVLRVANHLPAEDRDPMTELVDAYVQEVIGNEWPLMATEESSRQAEVMLEALMINILEIAQKSHEPKSMLMVETLRRYASDIEQARDQRLLVSHSKVSTRKWVSVFTLLFVAACVLYELHAYDMRALFASMLMLAIGFGATLYLVASYDRPFTGSTIIEPEPLVELLVRQR